MQGLDQKKSAAAIFIETVFGNKIKLKKKKLKINKNKRENKLWEKIYKYSI